MASERSERDTYRGNTRRRLQFDTTEVTTTQECVGKKVILHLIAKINVLFFVALNCGCQELQVISDSQNGFNLILQKVPIYSGNLGK